MSQIEITDLIDDAVENAIARREANLTTEEAKEIQGGFRFPIIRFPIILGYIYSGGEDGQLRPFGWPPSA